MMLAVHAGDCSGQCRPVRAAMMRAGAVTLPSVLRRIGPERSSVSRRSEKSQAGRRPSGERVTACCAAVADRDRFVRGLTNDRACRPAEPDRLGRGRRDSRAAASVRDIDRHDRSDGSIEPLRGRHSRRVQAQPLAPTCPRCRRRRRDPSSHSPGAAAGTARAAGSTPAAQGDPFPTDATGLVPDRRR